MMMASEVPTHSGMRTSSGTPVMRNTSYSTGMTIAPPPTPNSPANRPMTTPATTSVSASQISSEAARSIMGGSRFSERNSAVHHLGKGAPCPFADASVNATFELAEFAGPAGFRRVQNPLRWLS